MKKNLFFAAIALVALAGCTSDDFVGDKNLLNPSEEISFSSNNGTTTRAVGGAAAEELGYSFNVYATKTVSSSPVNVFATGAYSSTENTPYWVWYGASTANSTTSNTNDWDYVGSAGSSYGTNDITNSIDYRVTLTTAQTIKYWDLSATQYDFVAYKAKKVGATPTAATVSKLTTTGFEVTGTGEQLGALYIADKKTITSDDYRKVVQFNFRNAAAKVRLGIYETIPGYDVKNVSFRPNGTITGFTEATTDNAKLSGSFIGSSSSDEETYTVTFGTPSTFAITGTPSPSGYFDFGTFTSTSKIGESSTTPTWAGPTTSPYYSTVLPNPNPDNTSYMVLYVDYDLYNTETHETIHVTGAKAVVPKQYMTWKSNYAYTYLFKISDNTNGTTGPTEGTNEGLYPITFDAVTTEALGGVEGSITTVTTPSITTYQDGSVSDAGITYTTSASTKPIYVTVNTGGILASLTSTNIKLYTVDNGTTEADLMLSSKTKTAVTGSDALSILDANETVPATTGVTFESGKAAKFTPTAASTTTTVTYAIEYLVSAEVTYTSEDAEVIAGTKNVGDIKTPAEYRYKIIIVNP